MKSTREIEKDVSSGPDRRSCVPAGQSVIQLEMKSDPMSDSLSISVVVPTYNRCKIILVAIESVLAQTHSAFEIIVVDDGSSDGTDETLQRFIDQRSGT